MKDDKKLWILLLLSVVLRAAAAGSVELGNDEVYYRIFGLFPDWSYFDHPPMVAWLIRATTLGAETAPEFFVRLGAVAIGTVNTYLIYRIAGRGRTGFAAALLYTGSVYASVILGTFILPDTPMSVFWLLSLWIFLEVLPKKPTEAAGRKMLLAGVTVGLAMLSKYTGAYLWAAAGLYALLFNRAWLGRWTLWAGVAISLVFLAPVVWWNAQYDWVSFTFHSGRVVAEGGIELDYFGRELAGGVFYNNPVNFVLAVCAVVAYFRNRSACKAEDTMLLVFSLPLIGIFLLVSLWRETLPHWAAPAYFALMILTARWLKKMTWAYVSAGLAAVVLVVGVVQIKTGFADVGGIKEGLRIGRGDFTLDMYGWRQGGVKFAELYRQDVKQGRMPADASLLQYGWDDAAHVDMYFGLPLGLATKTIADTAATHYYEWINRRRGGFREGECMYLVSPSRYFFAAEDLYADIFDEIYPADTLRIYRGGKNVCNFYVYRLKGLRPAGSDRAKP